MLISPGKLCNFGGNHAHPWAMTARYGKARSVHIGVLDDRMKATYDSSLKSFVNSA